MNQKLLQQARKLIASEGGIARAKKLSKKRRSEIARMGALASNMKRESQKLIG